MGITIETSKAKDLLTTSIPTGSLTSEQSERLLELIKVEPMVSRSELTQPDADELSRVVNRSGWENNGARIEKIFAESE